MTDSGSTEVLRGQSAHQLDGFRIGITSDRRSEDLIAAFERRGAETMHAPAIRIAGAVDDDQVAFDTRAIIDAKPDILLATTSYGIRRWFEVADTAGLGAALTDTLAGSRILVRGPKARGAIRATGLDDSGMSERETTASLVDRVINEGADGRIVAVQLHGFPDEVQLERLREAGARVLSVAPYRWELPTDGGPVVRMIDAICSGSLDAVTFTSAPAVDALLSVADSIGRHEDLIAAMSGPVVAAAVGPVTSNPLEAVGIQPIIPDRFRMGALVRLVCDHLAEQRVQSLDTLHGTIRLRGRDVWVDHERAPLAPTSVLLMRSLISAGGGVVSRGELSAALNERLDDHAIDVAISRLRASLPAPAIVVTVIKRGYRIAV